MAIAFVNAIGGSAAFATSITTSKTVAAGSDRYLAGYASTTNSGTTVTGQTFNAVALAAVAGAVAAGGSNGSPCNAKGFELVAPAATTANFVTSLSDGNSSLSIHIAMDYTGVDQAAPSSGGVGGNNNNTNATFSVTTALNDLIVAFFHVSTANFHTISPGTGTTTRINTTQNRVGGDETGTGTGSQTIDWTWSVSDPWRGVAWNMKQAVAAPPAGPAPTGIPRARKSWWYAAA